jgi:hypothetical protein
VSRTDWRPEPAVVLVLLTRLVPLLGAPVTLWLVATRRPIAEQGLYFIFWNVQALTQLMELGVGSMLVHFASHEAGVLSWDATGALMGERDAEHRIRSMLRTSVGWYLRVGVALLLVAGAGGAWLLQARAGEVQPPPLAPWFVTIVCTAAYLPLIPLLCTIEGCGRLQRVQWMRLVQVSVALAALWVVLPRWGALWAVAAFAVVWPGIAVLWLLRAHPGLLSTVRHAMTSGDRADTGLEASQWRTAASWLAWWVAPQALTPILLVTHGPAAAGLAGMSLAIATAPLTLASAWLSARYPRYGALLASGARDELRRLALSATMQAAIVLVGGVAAAAAIVAILGVVAPALAARALPPAGIALLGAANLGWLLIQSLGSYLRAWREEPLTEMAVAGAAGVTAGTLLLASRTTVLGTIASYVALVVCLALPLAVLGFRRHHDGLAGVRPSARLGRP